MFNRRTPSTSLITPYTTHTLVTTRLSGRLEMEMLWRASTPSMTLMAQSVPSSTPLTNTMASTPWFSVLARHIILNCTILQDTTRLFFFVPFPLILVLVFVHNFHVKLLSLQISQWNNSKQNYFWIWCHFIIYGRIIGFSYIYADKNCRWDYRCSKK